MKNNVTFLIFGCVLFVQGVLAGEVKISFKELPEKLSLNKEIMAYNLNVESTKQLIKTGHSTYYPTLDLVGSIGEEKTLRENNSGKAAYIQGSWNIYRGGKDAALVEQTNSVLELAKINNRIRFQELLSETQIIFSDLLKLKYLEQLYQSESEYTKKHKQMASKKVSAGLTSKVDIFEFEIIEDFIATQIRTVKSEQDQTQQKLRSILNLGGEDTVVPVGEISNYKIDKKFPEADIVKTLTYKKLLSQKVKTEAERSATRSDFLPRLDLQASYGRITLQDFSDKRDDEKSIALILTIPLFSGFSTYSTTSAKSLEISSIDSNLSQLVLNLRSEIISLETQYEEANDLLKINGQRLIRSRQYYDLTLSEYKRGVKNSPDLVAATERLFEAQKLAVELKSKLQTIFFRYLKTTSIN